MSSDTSWLWILGAALVGAVLLLLGGGPAEAPSPVPPAPLVAEAQAGGTLALAPAAAAPSVTTTATASPAPAKGCGCQEDVAPAVVHQDVAWLYGAEVAPCGRPACGCGACEPRPAPRPACAPEPKPCESPCVQRIGPSEPALPIAIPCNCSLPCGRCEDPCQPSDQPPWPVPAPSPVIWPMGFGLPCSTDSRPGPLIDRHYPADIDEGGTAELRARIGGPSCTAVCYTWVADKGYFENADSLNPIYHSPQTDRFEGEDVCITLRSRDPCGGSGYDQIRVHIRNLNPWRAK